MARFTYLLVAAFAFLCFVCSTNVPEPRVQIDARGAMIASSPRHKRGQDHSVDEMVAMIKSAQATIRNTRKTASLIRTEVRRHLPEQIEDAVQHSVHDRRAQVDKALGLLEIGDVDCGESIEQADPVSGKLCRILHGNNPQVAGKLERAVKGLSLRPKTANATEMVVADASEDRLLTHLKAALWDLWFCAKRVDPPCDPLTSGDKKVKASRETAFDALHAIHMHAEDHSQTHTEPAKAPGTADAIAGPAATAAAVLPTAADAGVWPTQVATASAQAASLLQKDDADDPPATPACMGGCNGDVCDLASDMTRCKINPCTCGMPCSAAENATINGHCTAQNADGGLANAPAATGADAPKMTAASTQWATETLNAIMTGSNASGQLWDAIGNIDIDDQLQKDIIRITEDEDGNLKKLKASMLLLHECASMPECTGPGMPEGCCNPAKPEQAIYLQARNDAYIAYHQIQEDDHLGKQAYLELMGNIAHERNESHPDYQNSAQAAYHASRGQASGKKFPTRSCRHKTYNDSANPNRMTTGSYCADESIDTADEAGHVLNKSSLNDCKDWDCIDTAPSNSTSCGGLKFEPSPDPCWEDNKDVKEVDKTIVVADAGGIDILMIALVVVTVFVLASIAFLVQKTSALSPKAAAAAAPAGEEAWGEEGAGAAYGAY